MGPKEAIGLRPNTAHRPIHAHRENARWALVCVLGSCKAGRYTWYVFPGYEVKANATYGPILGRDQFEFDP